MLPESKRFDATFSHFEIVPECNRQTDGRRVRIVISYIVLAQLHTVKADSFLISMQTYTATCEVRRVYRVHISSTGCQAPQHVRHTGCRDQLSDVTAVARPGARSLAPHRLTETSARTVTLQWCRCRWKRPTIDKRLPPLLPSAIRKPIISCISPAVARTDADGRLTSTLVENEVCFPHIAIISIKYRPHRPDLVS